jgi:hypothetical protein
MNYPARRFIFDGKTMPTVIPKIFGRNTGQTYMLITPHQPGSGSTNYSNGGRDGCFSPRRTYPRRRRPSPGVKFRCGRKMRKTARNIVSCRGAADAHLPRTWGPDGNAVGAVRYASRESHVGSRCHACGSASCGQGSISGFMSPQAPYLALLTVVGC